MLKLFGAILILFAAYTVRRELLLYYERRLLLREELLRAVKHIRLSVGCYLKPGCRIFEGFESELLEKSGFIPKVNGGESLSDAFSSSCGEMLLSTDEKRCLSSLFEAFGKGYMEDEIRNIDRHEDELSKLLMAEREDNAKRGKLISVITASCALGLIILLV